MEDEGSRAILAPILVNFGGVFLEVNDSRLLARARRRRATISQVCSFLRDRVFFLSERETHSRAV